ncbi:hypothetical protein Ancab_002056 [Ancistrocladus abbreviatus]
MADQRMGVDDNLILSTNLRLVQKVQRCCLAAKLISDEAVNLHAAKEAIASSCKLLHEVKAKSVGPNTLLFTFDSEDDKSRILDQKTWTVTNHHLSLQELLENTDTDFYILCNLLSMENAVKIGSLLGDVISIDDVPDDRLFKRSACVLGVVGGSDVLTKMPISSRWLISITFLPLFETQLMLVE